jgi:hypothetical protein
MVRSCEVLVVALTVCAADARKFYPDDPLTKEPVPIVIETARSRKISDYYDLFRHVLAEPGEKQSPTKLIPAQDVNTLGEVLDGAWYEKRHARKRMSMEELIAGPGNENAPAEGPWRIIAAKSEGITPGFTIEDSAKRRYFLKFDPPQNQELATAADVITSKLFYALGYHVPENYIVSFHRSRLQFVEGIRFRDEKGRLRPLTSKDVGEILLKARIDPDGQMRASASLLIPGQVIREFRYFGTRSDDPNDIIPHEHRRMLRGLQVFCAWVNHDDSRAINTLDSIVEAGSLRYIKHYLIDFGSTLGSASSGPNSPRSGYEQFFTWKSAAMEFFTFGLYVPAWARIRYPDLPSVGRFSAEHFNPVKWTPEYPNPAFDNRLPADTFWAAKQVMAFTDDEIRAVVRTGRYSDPRAADYVADTLISRRNAIGAAYLSQPLSLDDISIKDSRLDFADLAVRYGYISEPPDYLIRWFTFDNETENKSEIPGASDATIPLQARSDYLVADITAKGTQRSVSVYVRRLPNRAAEIVGIDRVF